MGSPYSIRLCTILALCAALHGTVQAVMDELQVYGRHGSDVLIPGVEAELRGEGVLEWRMEKTRNLEHQWILTYYYGSNEIETHKNYEQRVRFSFQNASLQLFNLTDRDSGFYVLQLKYKDVKSVHVKVVEPISGIAVMKISSSNDCSVWLQCQASGEVWNLTWKMNGREVTQNVTRVGNHSELLIREVGTDSWGSYACVTWNPVSELESVYQLAQESIVGRIVVHLLLIAASVFAAPLVICWMIALCHRCCPDVKLDLLVGFRRAAVVSWWFFLPLALMAAIIGEVYSVAYGNQNVNIVWLAILAISFFMECVCLLGPKVKNDLVDTLPKMCGLLQGTLQIVRVFVVGGSFFTLIYFTFYFTSCGRPPSFALEVSLATGVPVLIIAILCFCVRPAGPCSRYYQDPSDVRIAKQYVGEEHHEVMEQGVNDVLVAGDRVTYVPEQE